MCDKDRYLCNNCGVYGHLFYNCKKPITSFGVICFRKNEKGCFEYLMVQRKTVLDTLIFYVENSIRTTNSILSI